MNWLRNVVILNATIFIWPGCYNGSIVIWLDSPSGSVIFWLDSPSGSVVFWPDSPSGSIDTRPQAGVASNLNWPGLNKHCTGCASLPSLGRWSSRLDSASGFPFFSPGL